MGCDIHLYVERLDGARWVALPPPERDLERWPLDERRSPWWGPGGCMYSARCYSCCRFDNLMVGCAKCMGTGRDTQWYHNRNYCLFAHLAGVRNECDVAPISEARGAPHDVSEYVASYATWDHTPSWYTLDELCDHDWSALVEHRGVMPLRPEDRDTFTRDCVSDWIARGDEGKQPRGWRKWTSSTTLDEREWRDVLALEAQGHHDHRVKLHGRVTWTASAREDVSDFLEFLDVIVAPHVPVDPHTMLVLRDAWAEERRDADVLRLEEELRAARRRIRLVFGFDS